MVGSGPSLKQLSGLSLHRKGRWSLWVGRGTDGWPQQGSGYLNRERTQEVPGQMSEPYKGF